MVSCSKQWTTVGNKGSDIWVYISAPRSIECLRLYALLLDALSMQMCLPDRGFNSESGAVFMLSFMIAAAAVAGIIWPARVRPQDNRGGMEDLHSHASNISVQQTKSAASQK